VIPRVVALGAAALFFAVAFGAFGAHALRERLDEYSRGVYEKAVFYHFVHALGILLVGLFAAVKVLNDQQTVRLVFMLGGGILLFSGSLYILAISGARWLGAVTPFGGTLFLVAWGYLAFAALTAE
jgi:uncharacterized membrane protein YgdD (TMEM256/DUF423 family)